MRDPRIFSAKLTSHKPSVGDTAKAAFHSNPQNTIFGVKRLIGRGIDDQDVNRDMKHWPFAVQNKDGKPVITVQQRGTDRSFVRIL